MSGGESGAERLTREKAEMRRRARARRHAVARAAGAAPAEAACRHFLADVALPAGAVVSAYWPLRDEFDCRPLMRELVRRGHEVALPVVEARGKPLLFRRWTPSSPLRFAGLGVLVPGPEAAVLRPGILLVPLLAFDDAGYRLGYGGGYYDRTLTALRGTALGGDDGPAPMAVGVAFARQRVDRVPNGPNDARLDGVLTEDGMRRIEHGTAAAGAA